MPQKQWKIAFRQARNVVFLCKRMLSIPLSLSRPLSPYVFCPQEVEYQRAMQRRAIRDAKTPEKMKQAKPVVDDSLTLQGKKDKIKSNLQRLGELGKVHPENRYQDLINDIAKVTRLACVDKVCDHHFYVNKLMCHVTGLWNWFIQMNSSKYSKNVNSGIQYRYRIYNIIWI